MGVGGKGQAIRYKVQVISKEKGINEGKDEEET